MTSPIPMSEPNFVEICHIHHINIKILLTNDTRIKRVFYKD